MSLSAQQSAAALLRSSGPGVQVNKNPAPATIALYPDDLVETAKYAAARIESTGSSADINPETMVQFEGDELVLDHGSLSVNTSRGVRVRVGCITVTPVNVADWTLYEVKDLDGKVTVSARKSDVYLDAKSSTLQQAKKQSAKSERSIVRETEQKAREERCGALDLHSRGTAAAAGGALNSPWAVGAGAAVIGGGAIWILQKNDDPISPAHP